MGWVFGIGIALRISYRINISVLQKRKHSKICSSIESSLTQKSLFKKMAMSETDDVEFCYPPIIQSGGNYVLKYSAER